MHGKHKDTVCRVLTTEYCTYCGPLHLWLDPPKKRKFCWELRLSGEAAAIELQQKLHICNELIAKPDQADRKLSDLTGLCRGDSLSHPYRITPTRYKGGG